MLPGGLRVVTEAMPGVRSAAFGVWVGVGSRDETPALAGTSHFLEHLLFKGTGRRDALEIAAVMDAVGGEMNAFTAKEYTCYYARVLDTDLPLAVDVVSDMVTSSLLTTADVESERGVILEEIAMHDDDPGDVVHDAFAAALFGDHPLGRPVIGTPESVAALSRTSIAGYWRRRYTAANTVVAVAGGVDHDEVVRLVVEAFSPQGDAAPAPVRPARRPVPALSGALGGGMSSRLFQLVREERGLAYSVYSYASSHADTGLFGVYAGCTPARAGEVVGLCREVLDDVAASGLTAEEVARTQGRLRGSLVLGLEDTGSRMSRLGKGELVHGDLLDVQEVLDRITAVTVDDVRALAAEVFAQPLALGVLGPFEPDEAAGWLA